MNLTIKTVCATLFILTVGFSSQGQISLDKFVYQTPNSTNIVEQYFHYEDDRVSSIVTYSNYDTITLSVVYDDEQYKKVQYSSVTNPNWNYSLSFRYNNEQIDTVFFMNTSWIGLIDLTYSNLGEITSIDQFVNIEGELVRAENTSWHYTLGRISKIVKTDYSTSEPNDSYPDSDHYHYNSNGQISQIDHFYSSSNFSGKEKFEYLGENLAFRNSITIPDEEPDEDIKEYTYTHYEDYSWDEIHEPFDLFRTLEMLGYMPSSSWHLRPVINAFNNNLIDKVVDFYGAEGEFFYSEPLVSSTEENVATDIPDDAIIYPNPVIDYLYFTKNFKPERVEIYSLSGQLECKMNYINTNVNLSDLQTGNYILVGIDKAGESIKLQFFKQ